MSACAHCVGLDLPSAGFLLRHSPGSGAGPRSMSAYAHCVGLGLPTVSFLFHKKLGSSFAARVAVTAGLNRPLPLAACSSSSQVTLSAPAKTERSQCHADLDTNVLLAFRKQSLPVKSASTARVAVLNRPVFCRVVRLANRANREAQKIADSRQFARRLITPELPIDI